MHDLPFTLPALRAAYAAGADPAAVMAEALRRIAATGDAGMFIALADPDALAAEAAALGPFDPDRPLWGAPFAVKDNIDVAGLPTTAACPAWAYAPAEDAPVVARLRAAGAICVGKTNLDQFATGLVGTRTPYPVPRNALDPAVAPGGSSSGSAVAVAQGAVAFSLGTDTAGSGRVPAALNGIVGLKPSLGALSARGVVPACRTLDTVSVFALTVEDAWAVFAAAAAPDPDDPFSRPVAAPPLGAAPPAFRVAAPSAASLQVDEPAQAESFEATLPALARLGATVERIDFAPFHAVAELLYDGPWVAERHAVIETLLRDDPDAVHPVTRAVVGKAEGMSATDAFRGLYRLAELRRALAPVIDAADLLCVPSIPGFPTLTALEADPIGPNARLGVYTNFVNLLDLCGMAVPAAARADGRPGGVTLLARHGRDATVAAVAAALHRDQRPALGATGWPAPTPPAPPARPGGDEMAVAFCGAHMAGLPLNPQIRRLGARFLRAARTAPVYGFYALAGGPPARPGLVRRVEGGGAVAVELWALPKAAIGELLASIPAPLSLGPVLLEDGAQVTGFLCEAAGADGATDITATGDWRAWLAGCAA